jgi:outer membrane protein TolC
MNTCGSAFRARGAAAVGLAAMVALTAFPAAGGSLDDPWSTRNAVAPNPSRYAQPSTSPACDPAVARGPLDLVSAVTLALCNNPQTHLAWTNALAQAAQVGKARAPYLPIVTACRHGVPRRTGSIPET